MVTIMGKRTSKSFSQREAVAGRARMANLPKLAIETVAEAAKAEESIQSINAILRSFNKEADAVRDFIDKTSHAVADSVSRQDRLAFCRDANHWVESVSQWVLEAIENRNVDNVALGFVVERLKTLRNTHRQLLGFHVADLRHRALHRALQKLQRLYAKAPTIMDGSDEAAEEPGPKPKAVAMLLLSKQSMAVLRVLAASDMRMSQVDIEAEARATTSICLRTVRKRLRELEDDGLVRRPAGPKGGYVITERGRQRLQPNSVPTT